MTLIGCAGDGGNQEGLYTTFAGTGCNTTANPTCGIPNFGGFTPVPGSQINPAACLTFQNGTYAPPNAAQPG